MFDFVYIFFFSQFILLKSDLMLEEMADKYCFEKYLFILPSFYKTLSSLQAEVLQLRTQW